MDASNSDTLTHKDLIAKAKSADIITNPESSAGEKRKLEEIPKFDGVTEATVSRWKHNGKLNVDCFLGFSDSSSESDKLRGAQILQDMGHFFCLYCESYVRGNKKSVIRHQTRNRKHVAHVEEIGDSKSAAVIKSSESSKEVSEDPPGTTNLKMYKSGKSFIVLHSIYF
jgi:hypothetical protein